MPTFRTTRSVQHSPAQMFALVADVERYPEFVPLCRSLTVRRRTKEGEGVEVVIADMTVAYKLVRETFRSKVTLDRPNLRILVEYLEGPFSRMQNRWCFDPTGEHTCEIEFVIDYEFRSRALGLLMGAMFDAAFRRFAALPGLVARGPGPSPGKQRAGTGPARRSCLVVRDQRQRRSITKTAAQPPSTQTPARW